MSTARGASLFGGAHTCPECGGVYSPPPRRLLLGNLTCPYCGHEQPVADLEGMADLAVPLADGEPEPPAFVFDKEAEPWRVDRDGVFGGLFAVGQVVVILGMMTSAAMEPSPLRSGLVTASVLAGILAFAAAFTARLLPEAWIRAWFTRRPRLWTEGGALHLRTRAGRMKLALGHLQLVTPLTITHLDKPTRIMLLGGADMAPLGWSRSPRTLVLHLDSGMTLALPLLLTGEQAAEVAGQLNSTLLRAGDGLAEQDAPAPLAGDAPAPRPHPRPRAGHLADTLRIPPAAPPREEYCPNCGARAELPPQVQFGDSVTCAHCGGLVAIRRLEESVLLGRIRLASAARMERQGQSLRLRQRRLGFRSLPPVDNRGIVAIWALFAVALGCIPVAMVLRYPAYVWIPVAATHLLPLLYLIRSTTVRGDRSDRLLTVTKVLAAIGSLGLWLLPLILYRFLGRFNPYRLRLDGGRLREGFLLVRDRQLDLDRVRRAMVFQWDRLEIVTGPDDYVERTRAEENAKPSADWLRSIYGDDKVELRAIWGLALELEGGQVYLSRLLSDRSTAELLALHINQPR